MDNFDRQNLIAIALFACWFSWLVVSSDATGKNKDRPAGIQAAQLALSPEYSARLNVARQLLAAGNMEKLKPLLDELSKSYPYQAEPLMLQGDYYIRLQQPVAAMNAFRQGLDLNLDYLEKKSSLYQGKKIKKIVAEAEEEIKRKLAVTSNDHQALENRKELYYMLRKLAGGCGD